MGKVITLLVLAGVMVGAISAVESTRTPSVGQIVTYTPAVVGTVGEFKAPSVIELAPVYIYAKAPAKVIKQTAQCGAFQFRAVAQGPVNGQVRGFCGGAL